MVEVKQVLSQLQPQVVINAAAYTAVDKAETTREVCFAVNAEGFKNLAEASQAIGAKLIQISTDYVFGKVPTERRPHTEDDQPCPIGVYAESKLAGEAAAFSNPNSVVVRSCGLYGRPGPTATGNFVTTMVRLGQERDSLDIVNDQHCTPTSVAELAQAVCYLAESDEKGLFHVTNDGDTTWHGLAEKIFELAGIDCQAVPITTEQYGAPAHRPRYSVLDISKYQATAGPKMSRWEDALDSYLQLIQSGQISVTS